MTATPPTPKQKPRPKYKPAVGPRLARLLAVVFGLFALLVVNSVYLVTITIAGTKLQGYAYQWMFLIHLVLGLMLIVPVVVFGALHIASARTRPNKRAIRVGYALFAVALSILVTGIVLTRVDLFGVRLDVNDPVVRSTAYWIHIIGPLAAIWLFILHRLAGKRIKWRTGLSWAAVAGVFAAVMLVAHTQDPRAWNSSGPESDHYFFPSLARTTTGDFIPERVLDNDQYCLECHADIHESWSHSVHKFSSFNNPPYLFSVQNTRRALMERDGNVQGARFCAGCHDPVPFFTGAFDDPRFDDPEYDLAGDPLAQAGITCTSCHAISHINTVRGNGDYTIDEPVHYPFTFSSNPFLRWVNRQLVKAKPEFHKATFLKPLHTTTEFCGTCHKVHLPVELNGYKWLRGQNHYDAFWLSGVSGQGITSFYYPPKAETSCNRCHMPLQPSDDFAAREFETDSTAPLFGQRTVHDHMFPSANTAIPAMIGADWADEAIAAHEAFNEDVMRVDLFGVREGGTIDGTLHAPLRPSVPALQPGADYLLETVIRTVKMGHVFTQGTSDSNEVWLEIEARLGDEIIGRSGGMADDGDVDPWSHFVNSFVIDREGNRIDRRNAEDIFTALYNHQIPPGAADVVHYRLRVPDSADGPLTVTARLLYRKFDTTFLRFVEGDAFDGNDLPIMTLATDSVTFPIGAGPAAAIPERDIPEWQRWNDFGIGLLRKEGRGELRAAESAFATVESLGRPDGPLNLARVYVREGRVAQDAPTALRRAADYDPAAPAWSVLWFTGLVNKQNGKFDEAIDNFKQILAGGFEQAQGRGFDFSKDYRLLNELANTLFLRAKQERGETRAARRADLLREAVSVFEQALVYDPENAQAHYGLSQVHAELGDDGASQRHAALHETYRPDDNARDQAVSAARAKYPAASHAAEPSAIFDLHRPGAEAFATVPNAGGPADG